MWDLKIQTQRIETGGCQMVGRKGEEGQEGTKFQLEDN